MNRVFIDMDGVIVDFELYMAQHNLTPAETKIKPFAYFDMLPLPGAIQSVKWLIDKGYEVWIATKPPTGVPQVCSDKVAWILKYLPELARRIIITHDKGLLGDSGDFLIDDRPHKANCDKFAGTFIHFKGDWNDTLTTLLELDTQ